MSEAFLLRIKCFSSVYLVQLPSFESTDFFPRNYYCKARSSISDGESYCVRKHSAVESDFLRQTCAKCEE